MPETLHDVRVTVDTDALHAGLSHVRDEVIQNEIYRQCMGILYGKIFGASYQELHYASDQIAKMFLSMARTGFVGPTVPPPPPPK